MGSGLYMEPKVNIIKYGLFDNLSQSWKEQRGPKRKINEKKGKKEGTSFMDLPWASEMSCFN